MKWWTQHIKQFFFVTIFVCSNIFICNCLPRIQIRKASYANMATFFLNAASRDEPVTGVIIIDHGSRRQEANQMLNLVSIN